MKKAAWIIALAAFLGALFMGSRTLVRANGEEAAKAPDIEMKIVSIQYKGTKFWIPSTIIARKGQLVRLHLVSKIPPNADRHGFAIDEFGVKAVVTAKKDQTVDFVADKEGLFRVYCHLHPAHVGGQLLVLQ